MRLERISFKWGTSATSDLFERGHPISKLNGKIVAKMYQTAAKGEKAPVQTYPQKKRKGRPPYPGTGLNGQTREIQIDIAPYLFLGVGFKGRTIE